MRIPVAILLLVILAGSAQAYVGPGLGGGLVGSLLAVVAGVFMLLVGAVYYPIKKLFGRKSKKQDQPKPDHKHP
jgi:TM2 domain-containing membrane protein YozV